MLTTLPRPHKKKLFFLNRRLRLAPPNTKLLAYNTFVRSVLEYANVVWFPFTKELINKLEAVQRKALRCIYNKYKLTDSPTELLKQAGILTLQNRAKLARFKMMYQLIHNEIKIDSSKYLSTTQTRPTRHKHTLTLNEHPIHTESHKHSFFPLMTREWNKLDPTITNSPTLSAFLTLVENKLHASQF